MCIAIVKENGVKLPKKTVLKRCFSNNPDGAGYAVLLSDKTWECKKGFMTWKAFWKSFNKEPFTIDDTILIHFRIGTSGKKVGKENSHPDCTHPFPITDDETELMKHHFVSKSILMHNGTCGQGRGDLSDTMVAIIDYVDPMLPYIESPKMLNVLSKCIGTTSRWFVAKESMSWMIGNWEQEKETGLWYSNRGYLPPKPVTTSYSYNTYSPYRYTNPPWYKSAKKDVVISETEASKFMFYHKDSMWSWEKFERLTTPLLSAPKKEEATYEIFDETTKELTMIVDVDGNIVWEKSSEDTTPFDCPYCTNVISDDILSDLGECPFCYEVVSISAEEDLVCPFCGEEEYLIEPVYNNNADTECVKCGALFDAGTSVVIGWSSYRSKFKGGGK